MEKKSTLLRLNQMIENRLVNTHIPLQMRNLVMADGTVTFTVLGDSPSLPWTLLDLEMLVEDRETGQGKALMQVYNVLHSLAQLLQLEVLHTQVVRLCQERLGLNIRIEEYILGRALTISYSKRPLMVVHSPSLTLREAQLAERSIRTERLSVESLLVHTIYVRTRARLTDLKNTVQERLRLGGVEASLHGSPAVLSVPILQPCLRSEQLLVSVDTHTGIFLAHVPQYPNNPFSAEIQTSLNTDQAQLESLVTQLRYWITARRIEKTLQQLPATPYEQLPLTYDLKRALWWVVVVVSSL